jgi:predicted nucleotidyltransferase
LGIEHRLHRKKILNCVHRLKLAEAQKDNKLNELLRESGNLEAPVCTMCSVSVFSVEKYRVRVLARRQLVGHTSFPWAVSLDPLQWIP